MSIAASSAISEGARSLVPRTAAGAASSTADNILQRAQRQSAQQRRVNRSRLETLTSQFPSFYEDLEAGMTKEWEEKEDRLVGVERHLLRLQQSLIDEQERRVEMLGTVEKNLTRQFDTLQQSTRAQLAALKPDIPARIACWHERLAAAEQFLDEERQLRQAAVERERLKLLKTLDDFQSRLEIEKVERLEREAQTLKKVVDQNLGAGQAIDDERANRESTLGHLRDEFDSIEAVREKSARPFKEVMIERMVRATKGIKLETSRRVAAERQFVESLESYTTALQGGLRMVNKKPPASQ